MRNPIIFFFYLPLRVPYSPSRQHNTYTPVYNVKYICTYIQAPRPLDCGRYSRLGTSSYQVWVCSTPTVEILARAGSTRTTSNNNHIRNWSSRVQTHLVPLEKSVDHPCIPLVGRVMKGRESAFVHRVSIVTLTTQSGCFGPHRSDKSIFKGTTTQKSRSIRLRVISCLTIQPRD